MAKPDTRSAKHAKISGHGPSDLASPAIPRFSTGALAVVRRLGLIEVERLNHFGIESPRSIETADYLVSQPRAQTLKLRIDFVTERRTVRIFR